VEFLLIILIGVSGWFVFASLFVLILINAPAYFKYFRRWYLLMFVSKEAYFKQAVTDYANMYISMCKSNYFKTEIEKKNQYERAITNLGRCCGKEELNLYFQLTKDYEPKEVCYYDGKIKNSD
jgi:hypothetical protein